MPHERIYSLDGTPDRANNAQIAWGGPSSPSNTGPGHGNEDGHVMVIVERPGTPARMAASVEEVQRQLAARIEAVATPEMVKAIAGGASKGELAEIIMYLVGIENLTYAYGAPTALLAVTIDRKGCNKMISALRRGRDAAFGRDE